MLALRHVDILSVRGKIAIFFMYSSQYSCLEKWNGGVSISTLCGGSTWKQKVTNEIRRCGSKRRRNIVAEKRINVVTCDSMMISCESLAFLFISSSFRHPHIVSCVLSLPAISFAHELQVWKANITAMWKVMSDAGGDEMIEKRSEHFFRRSCTHPSRVQTMFGKNPKLQTFNLSLNFRITWFISLRECIARMPARKSSRIHRFHFLRP